MTKHGLKNEVHLAGLTCASCLSCFSISSSISGTCFTWRASGYPVFKGFCITSGTGAIFHVIARVAIWKDMSISEALIHSQKEKILVMTCWFKGTPLVCNHKGKHMVGTNPKCMKNEVHLARLTCTRFLSCLSISCTIRETCSTWCVSGCPVFKGFCITRSTGAIFHVIARIAI